MFSAYAFNRDGIKSQTHWASWQTPKASVSSVSRRAYIIAIGVNEHENKSWNLEYAASDARVGADLLRQSMSGEGAVYDEVVTITLASGRRSNGAPTKANIRSVLARLAGRAGDHSRGVANIRGAERLRRAGPDDFVYLSFSGHGFVGKDGVFRIFPSDTGRGQGRLIVDKLLHRLISARELSNWLQNIDAGEFIIVIDACNSAASIASSGFKPGPMGSRTLGQLAYDKGMRLLAASQAEAVAFESAKIRHGTLSYALLLEGLEAGKADHLPLDGKITATEWLNYGAQRVPLLHDELQNDRFRPVKMGTRIAIVLNEVDTSQVLAQIQEPILFDFRRQNRPLVLRRLADFKTRAPIIAPIPAQNFDFDCTGLTKGFQALQQPQTLKHRPQPPSRPRISMSSKEHAATYGARIWSSPALLKSFSNCTYTERPDGRAFYGCSTRMARNNEVAARAKFKGLVQAAERCMFENWDKLDLGEGEGRDARIVNFNDPQSSATARIWMFPKRTQNEFIWDATLRIGMSHKAR